MKSQEQNTSKKATSSKQAQETKGIQNPVKLKADDPHYPSQKTLALIAAIVGRRVDVEPESAVEYAFKLWEHAGNKLTERQQEDFLLQSNLAMEQAEYKDIPSPQKYPAPFDEFLKLVVRRKTPADGTRQFRHFLRNAPHDSKTADERMGEFRECGFNSPRLWFETARDYKEWWAREKSAKARESAKKRKNSLVHVSSDT